MHAKKSNPRPNRRIMALPQSLQYLLQSDVHYTGASEGGVGDGGGRSTSGVRTSAGGDGTGGACAGREFGGVVDCLYLADPCFQKRRPKITSAYLQIKECSIQMNPTLAHQ